MPSLSVEHTRSPPFALSLAILSVEHTRSGTALDLSLTATARAPLRQATFCFWGSFNVLNFWLMPPHLHLLFSSVRPPPKKTRSTALALATCVHGPFRVRALCSFLCMCARSVLLCVSSWPCSGDGSAVDDLSRVHNATNPSVPLPDKNRIHRRADPRLTLPRRCPHPLRRPPSAGTCTSRTLRTST
eukprot:862271-Pleurochrysis_carterae.AAC.1